MKSITEQQSDEIGCMNYCIDEANKRIGTHDYIGAAVFLENAVRSLRELEKLKNEMEDYKNGKIRITATILGRGNPFN